MLKHIPFILVLAMVASGPATAADTPHERRTGLHSVREGHADGRARPQEQTRP